MLIMYLSSNVNYTIINVFIYFHLSSQCRSHSTGIDGPSRVKNKKLVVSGGAVKLYA